MDGEYTHQFSLSVVRDPPNFEEKGPKHLKGYLYTVRSTHIFCIIIYAVYGMANIYCVCSMCL